MRMRKDSGAAFSMKSCIFVSFSIFDGLDRFSCKHVLGSCEDLCEDCIFIGTYIKKVITETRAKSYMD